jgi:hypothetical protein
MKTTRGRATDMTRKSIWPVLWAAGFVAAVSTVARTSGHPSTLWNAVQDCADGVGIIALAFLGYSYLKHRRSDAEV